MKRLLLTLALLLVSSSAFAVGGTCPVGADYLSEPTDALVTLAALNVTNCYYVSSAGSDAAAGTTKATALAHAPGMTGCTGNCLVLYNAGVGAGTGLIFRGGDTWHYGNGTTTSTGLPWTCGYPKQCSGTAGNPVYIGFDQTWYVGASWSRPIFNMDNALSTSAVASCTYDDGAMTGALNHEPLFLYNDSYVIFDDFEFKGYCWNLTSGTYVYAVGSNLQVTRNYFHGWTYVSHAGASCTGGFCDTNHMITGSGSADTYALNTFDGADSSPLSGFAMYPQNAQDVHGNTFRHLSNSFVGGPVHTFHDNLAEYTTLSYDGTTHSNVFEFLSADAGNNSYYNNVIRHITASGAIGFWMRLGTQTSTDYVYNNVIYDFNGNVQGNNNCFLVAQPVVGTTTNTVNFFNNTFNTCTIQTNGNSVTHPYFGTLNFENGHFIGYSAQNLASIWSNGTGTYAGNATAVSLGGQIYQTEAVANGQGYTAAGNYAPTVGTGATIAAGTNLTSLCGTVGTALCSDTSLGNTRTPNLRPANWDTGAYQFSGSPPVNPPVITSPTTTSCSVNILCSYQILATNSPTSYSATGLPGCLGVNTSTGLLSGTCPGVATYSGITIGATNSAGTGTAPAPVVTVDYFVQQAAGSAITASSLAVPFSKSTTAGSLIVVGFDYPSTATVSSVFDSQSNAFSLVGTPVTSPGGARSEVRYAKNILGGADTVTVTLTGSATYIESYITEYSFPNKTNPFDVQAGSQGSAGPVTSGNATTTVAGDLIYGYCVGDSACTGDSGFSIRSTFNGNLIEDRIAGAPGPYAATGSANSGWTMRMSAFKLTSAPIPVPQNLGIGPLW